MSARRPTIRNVREGRTIAVVGDVYRFLATGDDTAGKYATWEAIVPPGGGPPPHVHSREEESFYVLEGEITFRIGAAGDAPGAPMQTIVAKAGMFASIPIGVPHSFKNEGATAAKMILSVAPAGLENMFFEIAPELEPGSTMAAPPTKAEIEKLLEVAPKYGVEILVPKH